MLVIILGFVLAVPLAVLRAVVVGDLWDWFVTPTFGVASPSFIATMGLVLLVQLLVFQNSKQNTDETETPGVRLAIGFFQSVVVSLIGWGFGFIWSLFM